MLAQSALLSVSDKTGLIDFARGLADLGIEILSTGGTASHLGEGGIPVTAVSEATEFPEILDGRVKTLHPKIHGGILADRARAHHLSQMQEHGIRPIDIVVVNLYPFEKTVANSETTESEAVDMIDIGGPCMLRAAAKNFSSVTVVVDPKDYPQVLAALEESGGQVPEAMRRSLALKAFRHTQSYDAAIAEWFEGSEKGDELFPRRHRLDLLIESPLRYGENPHQQAAVYQRLGGAGLFGGFDKIQGKELSYNNLLDADAARRMVSFFEASTAVIVKHSNPCGIGQGSSLVEAYENALACDPISSFGSIIATNRPVDAATAQSMSQLFVEVILAPEYESEALDILASKKNLRLLRCSIEPPEGGELEWRSLSGGFLAQTADSLVADPSQWTCPTKRKPTAEEERSLAFAWGVIRCVKSNAIVITNSQQTVGIGAGQMSRVDACRFAIAKAQLGLESTVAASDAFFPFRDGVDTLAEAGITAIVQPGGSKRDPEVIAAADELGLCMLMTGHRHFRH